MKQRKTYLDFIKVISCVLVVTLHIMVFRITATRGKIFTLPYYLYYMGGCAIPLFFMCSGYLTLNRFLNWEYIFNKIKNLIMLMILWSFIMYVLYKIFGFHTRLFDVLKSGIIQKGLLAHLWYLTALIVLYLISIPVQKQMQKGNGYKMLFYLFLIGLCFVLGSYYTGKSLQRNVYQAFRIWTSLFYFLLGGMMPKILSLKYMEIFQNKKIKILMVIYLLLLPFLAYFMAKSGFQPEYQYDALYVKIASFFIFVLAYHHKYKFPKIWQNLSQLTFGIYVIHAAFLHFFVEKYIKTAKTPVYLLALVVVVVSCGFITKLLLSNKVTKFLVRG